MNTIDLIQYINERFNNKYITDNLIFVSNKTAFNLTCPKHGEFEITRSAILLSKLNSACPKCKKLEKGEVYDTESCAAKIEGKFGKDHFDLTKLNYQGYRTEIEVGCKHGHGFFKILPDRLYVYDDCPQCSMNAKYNKQLLSWEEYKIRASIVHKEYYSYNNNNKYNGLLKPIVITCPKHGDFKQLAGNHLNGGKGCIKCSATISKPESLLKQWIVDSGIEIIEQHRDKYEIDIFIPSLALGIEFNGLYWHSELKKDKHYHVVKQQYFKEKGIRIIFIWEDEWRDKPELIKAYLTHQLNLNKNKTYARKCIINQIDSKLANGFLKNNHLQGSTIAALYLGIFYEKILVGVGAFTKAGSARGQNQWELIRYATQINIVGGLGKIMGVATRLIQEDIISYSDNDKYTGISYDKSGFDFVQELPTDYKTFTFASKTRNAKQHTKRENLAKILGDKFNPELTEHQNCVQNKIYRVYDSGKKKWAYKYVTK